MNKEIEQLKNQLKNQKYSSNSNEDLLKELNEQKTILDKQKVVISKLNNEVQSLTEALEISVLAQKELETTNGKLNDKVKETEETLVEYGKQMETLLEKMAELSMKEQEYLQQIIVLKKGK